MSKLGWAAVLVLGGVAASPCLASDEPVTVKVTLEQLKGPDAATILRSIAGVRGVDVVDDRTVQVTDEADTVELAKVVIGLAEHPSAVDEVQMHSVSDGTSVVSVHLDKTPVHEVMAALRQKVAIKRVAGNDGMSSIILRDTPEQVEASLALIREMEANSAPKQ